MSIGVVIPTYNRKTNLRLALDALSGQSTSDFVVAIADDGSTDGTGDAVKRIASGATWRGRLHWIGCGPRAGARQGRARNLGAQAVMEDCDFLVFLDSDVLPHSGSVAKFGEMAERYPGAVVFGVTDWLPPLPLEAVRETMRRRGVEGLRERVPRTAVKKVDGTYVGPELRLRTNPVLFSAESETLCPLRPEWSLASGSGYPAALFESLGGFDDSMDGYGYEDIELGVRASLAGADCVVCPAIWGVHVWHAKAAPDHLALEIQRNLDYVLRKHGRLPAFDEKIDWSCWWHYHRRRGGRMARWSGELWVVNREGTHRLKMDGEDWVRRLGFAAGEEAAADLSTENVVDMGEARLTPLDGEGGSNGGQLCG